PDKKLTGWYPLQGQWTVDDQGRLVGTRKEGFLAVCLAGFLPDAYEVEATVDLGEEKRAVNGGICVEYYSTASAYGLNLRREAQQAAVMFAGLTVDEKSRAIPALNKVHLTINNRQLSAEINGDLQFDKVPMDRIDDEAQRYIAVAGWNNADGNVIKWSRIRIHKLAQ